MKTAARPPAPEPPHRADEASGVARPRGPRGVALSRPAPPDAEEPADAAAAQGAPGLGAWLHGALGRARRHPAARHLRWLVPPALVALMLMAFGAADVGARLAAAHAGWIAAAVGCLLAQTAVMTLRWRWVARHLGLRFGLRWALREYLLAQLVNMTLPGGVLGDAARAVRSQAGPRGLRTATQAVVIERVLGQSGVLAVAAFGLGWAALSAGGVTLPPPLLRTLGLGALAAIPLGVLAAFTWRGRRMMRALGRAVPSMRARLGQGALALGAALLNVAAFAACARATGTVLGVQDALALVPLILTAMLVPFSVAGWGWREGAAAALFPLAGASAPAGVAAGIVYGGALLLAALPALPLMLRAGGPGAVAAGPGPADGADRTAEASRMRG